MEIKWQGRRLAMPWSREQRTSYSELVVAGLTALSGADANADLLAGVETAAGMWERALSAGRSSILSPHQLAMIGRSLLLTGESVWWKSRASGLMPVAQYELSGRSGAQSRWTYKVTIEGPDGGIVKNASAGYVLHVRIGSTPSRPWEGVSPLTRAGATRDALKAIETSLKKEHEGPTGHLLPVPNPDDETLKSGLVGLSGKTLLVEQSELGLPGEGATSRTTWTPKRIGPEPSEATIAAREPIRRDLLEAAGLPPSLVAPSTANSAREGLRQFLWMTINPVVRLVSAELKRIGLDDEIDMAGLNAGDLTGRARALAQLVKSGVPLPEARRLTGME